MKLFKLAKKFWQSEDGAVTVDWVVLTAAVVILGILALNFVRSGVGAASQEIDTYLSAITIQ
ncbi:Flp family type IVb pilin [Albidovulum sediminis]|jgi:hypothetical protein|uniref:Pilus assembly protein n=1 Tax=Albidovulum sediminis TaxID=3066345 RepID=A0ABT2NLV5_9RHOB|nr:hypothetical protein [Defluviimonas sediminis]MCT8329874.1 hypothetical protein [Defluviimonas sediminis]